MPCQHADWSPIAAAGPKSGFAAVLAGFVFACLVTVITSRGRGQSTDAVTIRLFLAAFVCLVADSYVALQLAGNQLCQRAWTESAIFNSLLTIGVVSVLSGLVWLISSNAFEKTSSLDDGAHASLQRFVVRLTYGIAAVSLIYLEFGARGYQLAILGSRLPAVWYGWLVTLYAPVLLLMVAIGVPVIRRRRVRRRAAGRANTQERLLSFAATATAVVVLIEIVIVSVLGDLSPQLWTRPSTALVAFGSLTPLVLASVPVLALVLALPLPPRRDTRAVSASDTDLRDTSA